MATVFFVCAFPPPIGGAAKNNQHVLDDCTLLGLDCVRVDTSVGQLSHGRTLGYHLKRMTMCLKNTSLLVRKAQKGDTFYIVPDGGLGLLYTLLYAAACATRRCRAIFHYRNFSYINKKSLALTLILHLTKNRVEHVFLDEYMMRCFEQVYQINNGIVVNNAAFLPQHRIGSHGAAKSDSEINIAYLSNLCEEKGLYRVIELIDSTVDPRLMFHIAGAPVSAADARSLADCYSRNKHRIILYGHLDGDAKASFYAGCDIFLFPTVFSQEAQPNVIWEAMDAGLFVLSHARGSISWMLPGEVGALLSEEGYKNDFHDVISKILSNPKQLMEARSIIRLRMQEIRETGKRQYAGLLTLLAATS